MINQDKLFIPSSIQNYKVGENVVCEINNTIKDTIITTKEIIFNDNKFEFISYIINIEIEDNVHHTTLISEDMIKNRPKIKKDKDINFNFKFDIGDTVLYPNNPHKIRKLKYIDNIKNDNIIYMYKITGYDSWFYEDQLIKTYHKKEESKKSYTKESQESKDRLNLLLNQIQNMNNRITNLEENFNKNINSVGDRITYLEGSFNKEIDKSTEELIKYIKSNSINDRITYLENCVDESIEELSKNIIEHIKQSTENIIKSNSVGDRITHLENSFHKEIEKLHINKT